MKNSERFGFVAIIGPPNAGKSTLLNNLVGTKLAIVTPKAQTTRFRVLGICISGASQLAFVDTPGIFEPRRRFDRAMVKAAWSGAYDADIVVVVVDAARGHGDESRLILEGLRKFPRKAFLALNKIDRIDRARLLPLAAEIGEGGDFAETFMISATTGDGVEDLKQALAGALPEGPWMYPADQLSNIPMRLWAAEITRERLFISLQQELPYALTVETEQWDDRSDGSTRIDQSIHVARESHKPIVIGQGGRQIKAVGQKAREELSAILGHPVHLFLRVKVSPKWDDDPARYRSLGLPFPGPRK